MIKLELTTVVIDGIKFQIQEFNWKKSIAIQKKVGEIISPVLNVLSLKTEKEEEQGKSILDKLEIQNLGDAIKDCLLAMDDPFLFFKEIFSSTSVFTTNKSNAEGVVLLDNDEKLNETFHKKTLTAIKLVIEVLKFNELSFSNGLGGLDIITGMFKNLVTNSNMKINE